MPSSFSVLMSRGVDCAHDGDLTPTYILGSGGDYRDVGYVTEQIAILATALRIRS